MAQNTVFGNAPLDTPLVERPGIMHREGDHSGAAKHYALPPEHPERAAKGDLGMVVIPGLESRPSFESPGLPFGKLRDR
jgi:hypothetical protein